MDEREERFVIKFLWLPEQWSKSIHAHLRGTLGDLAVSLPNIKRWLRRFREGDTCFEEGNRAGRPPAIFGDVSSKFFSKYPFVSAKNVVSHFDITVSTVKDFLAREPRLRKYPRRWVPLSLSERQKNGRVSQSRLLLDLLQCHQTADFNATAAKDES
jgi:transposase